MTDLPVETKISTAYDLARLGALLLEAGESVTTVRSQMKSITTEHLDHLFEFSVLPTVVFVTDSRTGRMVAVNTSSDLSFRQAAQANRLPALIRLGRVQLSEVPHYAQRVRESIRASSTSRMLFGNAIVGGSFSTLFLSPVWAILAATVVGGLVGLVMRVLEKSPQGVALEPFVVSFISGTLMMTVADAIGQGDITPYAMVAPVVVLVPGATIAKALVESTSADIISGAARLLGGVIIMAFIVAGLTAGSVVANSLGTDLLVSTGGFHEFFAGWYASPPPGLAWIGVIGLAVSVGVVFDSGIRLGAAIVVVMCLSYLITWLVSPLTGAAVATGVGAGVVFFIAKCVERLSPSLPAAVTFFPAFLLFVPGTLALVSFMTHDTQTISTALIAFASLCIGIHVSAFIDLWLDKTFWNNYRKRMKI